MNELYLSGRWTVRPGLEEAFVDAWEELARWSARHMPASDSVRLLQQQDRPTQFVGFWSFSSPEALNAWRADPQVTERFQHLQALLTDRSSAVFELRVWKETASASTVSRSTVVR